MLAVDYKVPIRKNLVIIWLPTDDFEQLQIQFLDRVSHQMELDFVYDIALQLIRQNILEGCRLNKATCTHYMKSQLSEQISTRVNLVYRKLKSTDCSEAALRQEYRELAFLIASYWHQPLYNLCVEWLELRPDYPIVLRHVMMMLDKVIHGTNSVSVIVGAPLINCRHIYD